MAALAVIGSAAAPSALANAPFASGDSAANIALNSASKQVLLRWVARQTGTLQNLGIRVKLEGADGCNTGSRSGYADGTAGLLAATTYPVLADGRPDVSTPLSAQSVSPCSLQNGETIALPLGLAVTAGAEYATVIRNADASPASNWFSVNFLYVEAGLKGANGRNERSASATDTYYGLDPRELVGYTTSGGASWSLPGGPYGSSGGKSFIPTYVQEFTGGAKLGQPYYYTQAVDGPVTMDYRPGREWTITQLGAYSSGSGSAAVHLLVDGVERASATLSGTGFLTADIAPVTAPAGATVRVTTTASSSGSSGLRLKRVRADAVWVALLSLSSGWIVNQDGSNKPNPVSVFPLPSPGDPAGAAPAATVTPANTAAPAITGTPRTGGSLGASTGSWSGTAPLTFTRQWLRCTDGSCAAIAGATGASYTPVSADVSRTLAVRVTATNAAGSATATSGETITVVAGASTARPRVVMLPEISGSAVRGSTLRSTAGTWTGVPTSVARTWLRCNPAGAACAAISGATGSSYVVTSNDVDRTIRVRVTARNRIGTTTTDSAATALVRRSGARTLGTTSKVVKVSDAGVASVEVRCTGRAACADQLALVVGRSVGTTRVSMPAGTTRIAHVRLGVDARQTLRRNRRVHGSLQLDGTTQRVLFVKSA